MNAQIQTLELTANYVKFVLTPLERGYGQTIGNTLRRVLLSSIPGAAITAVRVDKVLHEFAAIPGVKEDMSELLLNLRDVAIRVNTERPPEDDSELVIDIKGKGRVTGADIQTPDEIEIINPEVYICTMSEAKTSLYVELYVSWGTGYVLPERQERYKGTIGIIPMGSQFTPVKKVNYTVEQTRVGQRTDFERLTLEVWTTGAVAPNVAVTQASQILDKYFRMFFELGGGVMDLGIDDEGEEAPELAGVPDIRVEEMDFSQRTFNCLRRANLSTLKDIVVQSEADLFGIRGFGKKALQEVRDKLAERGLELKPGKAGARVVEFDDDDEEEDEE
ncbi:MAG: DNA-directed RNA polymerase subunit alpha [Fimbriimonadales bacterium]